MGNILGESFSSYVRSQIEQRQNVLGNSSFSDSQLKLINSKGTYLKLISSINLGGVGLSSSEKARLKTKFENIGVPSEDTSGSNLAKKFILFGGASNDDRDLKSGLTNGTIYDGAYGWGGIEERGYVPMPGITGVETKYYNNGALSETTISIKCFSRKQFGLVDLLYLRPGFTLLLEFGHSTYITNSGNTEIPNGSVNTAPAQAVLDGDSDQFKIYQKIENTRSAYDGNYEAIYGKISKFNWSFNKDGSYDCSVTIIGLGSIIESLKLNNGPSLSLTTSNEFGEDFLEYLVKRAIEDLKVQTGFDDGSFFTINEDGTGGINTEKFETLNSINAARRDIDAVASQDVKTILMAKYAVSYLHIALYNIKYKATKNANADIKQKTEELKQQLNESINNSTTYSQARYYRNQLQNAKALVQEQGAITVADYTMKNFFPVLRGANRGTAKIPSSIFALSGVRGGDEEVESPQIYLKFGLLISLIQQKLLVYEKGGKPFFKFDMHSGWEKIYSERAFQTDENYILNVPGQISGNPMICLIPHTNIPNVSGFPNLFNGGINKELAIKAPNLGFKVEGDPYAGRLANILVNIDHIINVLQNSTDAEEGTVKMLDFLQTILADICRALGGVNKIDVTVTDDGLVQFIEKIPPQYSGILSGESEPSTINAFGVQKGSRGSFVRDVSLESELSSDFSAMIAIGAQANGNQVGADATSFAKYNEGLTDRVIKEKQSYFNQVNDDKEEVTLFDLTEDLNIPYIRVYSSLQFTTDNLASLESANTKFVQFLYGALSNASQMTPPFFLPFNLSLTMDGLSGMKLYQRFKVNDNILPPSYTGDDVDLIIKGVNHTVGNNGWTTKVDTLSAPSFSKTVGVLNRKDPKDFPETPAQYLETAFDNLAFINGSGAAKPMNIPPDEKARNTTGYVIYNGSTLSSAEAKGFNFINRSLYNSGFTNPYARLGILCVVEKESSFEAKSEHPYNTTSNTRIREIFSRPRSLTDDQLTELKANTNNFWDFIYGNRENLGTGVYAAEKNVGPGYEVELYDLYGFQVSTDGHKYLGKGYNQITGRHNMGKYTRLIGGDLPGSDKTFRMRGPATGGGTIYKFSTPNFLKDPDMLNRNRRVATAAMIAFMQSGARSAGFNWNDIPDAFTGINAAAIINSGGNWESSNAADGVASALESSKKMVVYTDGNIIHGRPQYDNSKPSPATMKLESGIIYPRDSKYLHKEAYTMSEEEQAEVRRQRSGAFRTEFNFGVGGVAKASGGILGAGYGGET